MRSRGLMSNVRALVLACLLLALPLRRVLAEDRLDFKWYYYKEDGERVQSWGPSFHWETDLNPETTLRIGGVFDVISGATPTGAPLTQKTRPEVVIVPVGTTTTTTNVVSGASGKASAQSVTSTHTVTEKQIIQVPFGPKFLPMATFNDQRVALNAELSRRFGDYVLTGGLAASNESDYNSLAASLKLDREFNNKNTIVSLGVAGTHDLVKNVSLTRWDDKDTVEIIAGFSQVLDPRTLFSLNYSFATQSGYLDDPYKLAQVGTDIIAEHRPSWRDKHAIYATLSHFFDCLNGSIEGGYRFYTDSFGIDAHTYELTWNQKIGRQFIISPNIRYYEQSAADFYGVQFVTKPEFYSADYRLSKLSALSYGITVTWKPKDKFAVDAGYERYSMWGRDGQTSGEAYPDANMVTLGIKIWF